MLAKISPMKVLFRGNFKETFESTPPLDEKYTTPESKAKTITVLGSSRTTSSVLESMDLCSKVTKDLVNSGYNILTGCGAHGIMGSAYNAAKENSVKDIKTGKPLQNLTIIMEPAWGEEDFENCVSIGRASSEAERITKFSKTSDNFIVFPGSATTMQESVTLIQKNEYTKKNEHLKKIILVGKEFFSGLTKQYQTLYDAKLLKHTPDELFKVVETEGEILNELA
jgi:predicted Rossmann-fold nucleotide-binding protein